MKHLKKFYESDGEIRKLHTLNNKYREDILKFASNRELSAHDIFDDLCHKKVISTFYSEECPKDQSGMVLTIHDAEILAYEYARRLLNPDSTF